MLMNPSFIPGTKTYLMFEGGLDYSGKTRLDLLNDRKLSKSSGK